MKISHCLVDIRLLMLLLLPWSSLGISSGQRVSLSKHARKCPWLSEAEVRLDLDGLTFLILHSPFVCALKVSEGSQVVVMSALSRALDHFNLRRAEDGLEADVIIRPSLVKFKISCLRSFHVDDVNRVVVQL